MESHPRFEFVRSLKHRDIEVTRIEVTRIEVTNDVSVQMGGELRI